MKYLVILNSLETDGFGVRNFLHIPQTYILIINTIYLKSSSSNVIYYNDMSKSQGEIINVIKPEYIILEMDYIPRLNKILVTNYEKIIIADPYTLKIVSQIYNQQIMIASMIPGTDYAHILLFQNQIKIFDTVSVNFIITMDHTLYLHEKDYDQYYSKVFKLKCQDPLAIIISNRNFLVSWDLDIENKVTKYHGIIEGTYHADESYYQRFTKHPDEDIIFLGGIYYEITAFRAFRNEKGLQFEKLMQINLYDREYSDFISSLEFAYKDVNSIKTPFLYCGDWSYITEVQLDIDLSKNKVEAINPSDPYYRYVINQYNTNNFYKIEGSKRFIIASDYYVTVYDYQEESEFYYLFFNTDYQSKKLPSYDGDQLYIVSFNSTNLNIYKREVLNKSFLIAKYKFLPMYTQYNNVFSIKNCNECALVKSRDKQDYISITTLKFDHDSSIQSNIQEVFQFNWDFLSTQLDPFFYKDTTWFVVGFPDKSKLQIPNDCLFYLINATNLTIFHKLKSPNQMNNNRNTTFALVSLEDVNNLEILGLDDLGTIYVWGMASENFDFKYSFQFSKNDYNLNCFSFRILLLHLALNTFPFVEKNQKFFLIFNQLYLFHNLSIFYFFYELFQNNKLDACLNSQIGDIFHYKQTKKLVLACDDFSVRIIDTVSKKEQKLMSLISQPLVVRAFSSLQIIVYGEKILSETYIYKYNPDEDTFEMFLTISSGQFKSLLIWIELLKDNILWIQYSKSYTFYKLGDCINNSILCTQCSQSYYFDTNNNFDINGLYGNGTIDQPFTSSKNFITAIVRAQYYKELVQGVSNMSVDISISPNNMMTLSKEIITFDFTSIILITFQSTEQNNVARVQYYNQLILQNYNSITFKNIEIFYNIETDQDTCGLLIIDVKNQVIIDNIQGCQQIQIQNSFVQIKKYKISSESFSESKYLISTINSDKIVIENLIIDNCEFGDSFQILQQQTNLIVELNNLQLTNNYCVQNLSENSLPRSLFSAGIFTVSSVHINGNTFCNKNIFTTIASQNHINQIFEFSDIEIYDNVFYLQTTYIFFNSLYSMLSLPSHQLIMKNIKFKNNKLQNRFQNELLISQYVQTYRIAKLQFDNIYLENHTDIQFSLLEFGSEVVFNNFHCTNDDAYQLSIPNEQLTAGCIEINEYSKVTINQLIVDKKKALDNSLLIINNIKTKQSIFEINNSEFKNLILNQSQINTYANPIHIESSFQVTLGINNCNFENNILQTVKKPLTHSTTALWIQSFVGSVIIQNSLFNNCQSDSSYNFIYIQCNLLQIENVILSKSSFNKLDNNQQIDLNKFLFKQQGGMINAKVNILNIINSQFNKSTAQIGSFLYIQQFNEILTLNIKNSQFSEGYSLVDGGAFFIDTQGSSIQFQCILCEFNNIYTLQNKSSAISFQKYTSEQTNELNTISFIGGFIKNVYGVLDNYFIECLFSQTSFANIQEIMSYEFNSYSDAHKYYSQKGNYQQSTLMNLNNSTAIIQNCSFFNLKINNPQSTYPLLINAKSSTLLMKQSFVKDSFFFSSAIKFDGGKVVFEDSKFINVNQFQNKRYLQQFIESFPNSQANSLIIVENGELKASQSQFKNIICSNNCNGGVFQVKNGNIGLESIQLVNSESTHGGCLFVNGAEGNNIIKKVEFQNCKSQYDGGAIYFQSNKNNKFNLYIDESDFTSNISKKSKGGAIYIILDAQNPSKQVVNITSTNFTSNVAQIGGAIYQQNISSNISDDTKFLNNQGEMFGMNTISYPTQLYLINQEQFLKDYNGDFVNQMLEIYDFRSGDFIKNLQFQLKNEKNEIIIPVTQEDIDNYNVKLKVSSSTKEIEKYNIRGNLTTQYNSEFKTFQFNDLYIVGNPGTYVIIEFRSDQIYNLNLKSNSYEQTYSFKIKINFRQCISGEQILAYNNLKECDICPEKKYSYGVKQCNDCPTGASCSGGMNVFAIAGYWRKTDESSEFLYCNNLEENCSGGSFGNQICYEGHIGALCEECDIYGENWSHPYSKVAKYKCVRCDLIQYNLWLVVFVTIWTMITMTLAIKGDIDNAYQKITEIIFTKNTRKRNPSSSQVTQESFNKLRTKARSIVSSSSSIFQYKQENRISKKQEKSGIYIKIFTNYMQIVSSVATFNLKVPTGIFEFPQSLGSPLKQTMNSLDCALQKINTDVPIIYLRLIFSINIVLIYFCLFLIGVCLYFLVKKQKRFPWYVLSTASMFLIIYAQPDLVDQTIALLSCRPIGDTNYILANVSYECYSDEHMKFIGILVLPLFLIWVFILPVILFLQLKKNRHKLNTVQIKLKYGFLYKEYKEKAFYWEFVKIIEKIAILLFLNFYSQSVITKGILVFITITVYGIVSFIIEPYEETQVNQLDVHSTNVCAVTILLGLFIYKNDYDYFIYCSLAIIIIINSWFIIILLRKIIERQIERLKQLLQNILDYLPILQKCFKKQIQNKKIDLTTKQKTRKVFEKYLDMKPFQKKQFLLKMMEDFFNMNYGHRFKDDEDAQKQSQSLEIKSKQSTKKESEQQTQQEVIKQYIEEEKYENYISEINESINIGQQSSKFHQITGLNLNTKQFDSDNYFFDNKILQTQIFCTNQSQDDSMPICLSNNERKIKYQMNQQNIFHSKSEKYLDKQFAKIEEIEPQIFSTIQQKLKNYEKRTPKQKQY